ncbi:PilZ domain-containing protein [Novosphingobium umbonatum]|uniref:PilZ domain-containing protein n=1 Tax=Novosphingobium umbonatum TaxID=1908524 RepID=A0A3S2VUL8_9SPHN|nr:PilZ domain-containing protein [Novosphingobium umbonatum]RVU06222.1 PilZ domain-containing protein [Novosphingobium umbonatum]
MAHGAQLSVTDLRRSARHPVNYRVLAEHRRLGEFELQIANVSAHGFMAAGELELGRGERLTVRLPVAGRIEAHLIWNTGERAGFQFERIIRLDDFNAMMAAMQPNPRLRRER